MAPIQSRYESANAKGREMFTLIDQCLSEKTDCENEINRARKHVIQYSEQIAAETEKLQIDDR
jgi:hypothetical protein